MKLPKRVGTSLRLFAASIAVVRRNPRLLLFPLVSFTVTAVVAAVFFGIPATWFIVNTTGHGPTEAAAWAALGNHIQHWSVQTHAPLPPSLRLTFALVVGAIYFCSIALATFFNVGFYHQIMEAMNGGAVSVRTGLRFAWSKREPILLWSLFAASVGMVLRALSERFGPLGRWVLRLVGATWTVAAVFVTSVMVRSDSRNPVELLRYSASTLKKTWGESLVGFAADTVSGVVLLIVLGALNIGMLATAGLLHSPLVYIIFVPTTLVLSVVALLAFAFLSAISLHIYRCALYVYASEGVIPEPFNPELMDSPWKIGR